MIYTFERTQYPDGHVWHRRSDWPSGTYSYSRCAGPDDRTPWHQPYSDANRECTFCELNISHTIALHQKDAKETRTARMAGQPGPVYVPGMD